MGDISVNITNVNAGIVSVNITRNTTQGIDTCEDVCISQFATNRTLVMITIVLGSVLLYRIVENIALYLVFKGVDINTTFRTEIITERLNSMRKTVILGWIKKLTESIGSNQVFAEDECIESMKIKPIIEVHQFQGWRGKLSCSDPLLFGKYKTNTRVNMVPNKMARKLAIDAVAAQTVFNSILGFSAAATFVARYLSEDKQGNADRRLISLLAIISSSISESFRILYRFLHYRLSNRAYSITAHNHMARAGLAYKKSQDKHEQWRRMLWIVLDDDDRHKDWAGNPYNGTQYVFWEQNAKFVNSAIEANTSRCRQFSTITYFTMLIILLTSASPDSLQTTLSGGTQVAFLALVSSQLSIVLIIVVSYFDMIHVANAMFVQCEELNDKVHLFNIDLLGLSSGKCSKCVKCIVSKILLHICRSACWPLRQYVTRASNCKNTQMTASLVGGGTKIVSIVAERKTM